MKRAVSQIVYRCDFRDCAASCLLAEQRAPAVIDSPVEAMGRFNALVRVMGVVSTVRLVLRLCRPGRLFYFAADHGQWMHWGGITLGWCRYYRIGEGEAVFGPVETAAEFRGRGVAPHVMSGAMRVLAGRGIHVFYVDTSEQNLAMQQAALKAGFKDTGVRYER